VATTLTKTRFELSFLRLMPPHLRPISVTRKRGGSAIAVEHALQRETKWTDQQLLMQMDLRGASRLWQFLVKEFGTHEIVAGDKITDEHGAVWIVQIPKLTHFEALWECVCTREPA
jgi:hypothetical protein